MEPAYIFYKELPTDEKNLFSSNISEKNEVENVIFKKNQEYAVTGIAIKPDIVDSDIVKVIDQKNLQSLSKRIQELGKKYKEPDLDLKISNPETKDLVIPFQKKSETDCPPIKLTFFNTTNKKNEEFSVYDYFKHIKNFGFEWKNKKLMFKFTITLSKDEKKLIKRMTMSKSVRCKLFNDECRVWNMDITGVARRSYMVGYMEQELHVFNMLNIHGASRN